MLSIFLCCQSWDTQSGDVSSPTGEILFSTRIFFACPSDLDLKMLPPKVLLHVGDYRVDTDIRRGHSYSSARD